MSKPLKNGFSNMRIRFNVSKNVLIILALCGLACGGVGTISNPMSVFFTPVASALNIKVGSVSLYATIINISSALTGMVLPRLITNNNFKKILLFGSLGCLTSLTLMGLAKSIIYFYILAVAIGICYSVYSIGYVMMLVNSNVRKNIGTLSAIISCCMGLAGAVLSPILTSIIINKSYKLAYFVMGLISFVCCIPALLIPMEINEIKRADKQKINYSKLELILMCVLNFIAMIVANFPNHFIGVGLLKGLTTSKAALMLSASMIGNVVFKIINGRTADKLGIFKASAIICVVNCIANIIFYFTNSFVLILICCVCYGTCYTITSFGMSMLCERVFRNKYGLLYPIVGFIGSIGAGLATTLIGYCFDFTGSYNLAFYAVLIIDVIELISYILMNKKYH